jgi:Methyltransferase domain
MNSIPQDTGSDVAPTLPSAEQLARLSHAKFAARRLGWGPRLRKWFGYYTPDDVYEALVEQLVTPRTTWLDVGCGRFLFPSNPPLAKSLSERCKLLVGVDPDATIEENQVVHRRVHMPFERYVPDTTFDLLTLRMVAEHVVDPDGLLASIKASTHPRSLVVIYTPYKWSPVSLLTRSVPFGLHHPIKRVLWRTETKDTFPVAFKMNTRKDLRDLFRKAGFEGVGFWYLDDCRLSGGFLIGNTMELSIQRFLRYCGLRYPELCILAVFRRS